MGIPPGRRLRSPSELRWHPTSFYGLIQLQPYIQIAWFLGQPRFDLNVGSVSLLDFVIETALVGCWWYFKGDWNLLVALLFPSITNLPMMFPDGNGRALANNHLILPTIILVQTIVTNRIDVDFGRRRNSAQRRTAVDRLRTVLTRASRCRRPPIFAA